MFKASITPTVNGCKLELFASNYFAPKTAPLIIERKTFETREEATAYFISCSHSFLHQSFDAYTFKLSGLSATIMQGNRGGSADNRMLFIENYWKLIELKNEFFAPANSIFRHASFIMNNSQILINTIPRDHSFDYNFFRELVLDLIKVSAMLLRALDKHIEENKKEWHEMTNEDIAELLEVA